MKRSAHPPRRKSGGRRGAQRKTQFNPLHVVACGAVAAAQQYIPVSDDGDENDEEDDVEGNNSDAPGMLPVTAKEAAKGDKETVAWGTLVWEKCEGFVKSCFSPPNIVLNAQHTNTQGFPKHCTHQRRRNNRMRSRQHCSSSSRLFGSSTHSRFFPFIVS